MRLVTTVCPRDCYDTCALIATLDESGQIVSMRGDPTHPLTRGLTCPRAAADPKHLYQNRVQEPYLRQNPRNHRRGREDTEAIQQPLHSPRLRGESSIPAGQDDFRAASWEQALDAVAGKLAEALARWGPEAVLYLTYSGNTGLLTLDIPQRLWNALGATQTDMALCSKSGSLGLTMHYGARYGVRPEDLADMGLIVFWGFNAAISSLHLWALAREARRHHGTRIVVVDSRRSETAAGTDLWIRPRPGSDVALAYGLINLFLESGAADLGFIAQWTRGFEQLLSEAGRWTPQRVQKVSDVPPDQLQQLADAYAQSRRSSATMIGIGLQKCDRGSDQVRAVSFIPAVLGQHRGFYYSNSEAFHINRELLSGERLTDKQPRIVPQVALPELLRAGQFKFVYISGMNPATTLPNTGAFAKGLSRDDVFVVVHETHWTETARCADVVLPAPTYLEKDDLVPPWSHNCLQLSPQVVQPVTDSRREGWVMQELARRLGLTQEWLYEDPWDVVRQALQGALEDDVSGWARLLTGERVRLKRKPRDYYPTPSGKIEFDSTQAREMDSPGLPVQAPLPQRQRDKFIFLNSASAKYTSSQFREVYGAIPALVVINPHDARRLGIGEGAAVEVSTHLAAARAKATISDSVPEGTVWSPRQWAGQNALLSSLPQEIGHGPRFNSTRVKITPLGR
jgi:anaerobic selenocysteine-containing dehydrogenase